MTRHYPIEEMNNIVFPTVRDLVKDATLPEEHREDVANAHPFLLPLVEAMKQDAWKQTVSSGKIVARFFGSQGSATIAIEYPAEALVRGWCLGFPRGFHFIVKDGMFQFVEMSEIKSSAEAC